MRLRELFADTGTHIHLDENLMELTFHGSQCTKDCSGHKAGYAWSAARGGVQNPASHSPSFVKGSNIAHRMMHARKQGGGRIAGVQSQTPNAVAKRTARAQARAGSAAMANTAQQLQHMQTAPVKENLMRLQEFAPDGEQHGGSHHPHILPWHQFAKLITHQMGVWRMSVHNMGHEAIQCHRRLEDEQGDPDGEVVDLHIIFEAHGDNFRYMIGSQTNGERDAPVDDDQSGERPRTTQDLARVVHLAKNLFGFLCCNMRF